MKVIVLGLGLKVWVEFVLIESAYSRRKRNKKRKFCKGVSMGESQCTLRYGYFCEKMFTKEILCIS